MILLLIVIFNLTLFYDFVTFDTYFINWIKIIIIIFIFVYYVKFEF